MEDDLKLQDFDQWVKIFILKHEGGNLSRDTYLDLDSFTLFYTANCNVTVAVTYFELDNVTSKLDTNFLCTSSKSVN